MSTHHDNKGVENHYDVDQSSVEWKARLFSVEPEVTIATGGTGGHAGRETGRSFRARPALGSHSCGRVKAPFALLKDRC